jgi:hypothetical protein
VNSIGLYPRVQVDSNGSGVVSQSGAVVLVEAARAAGLGRGLSTALAPWCKPMARHDPGKVITDLAFTLALGGDCLADIAVLRAEPRVFGPVASDPTVSRTIDALAADGPRALKAINTARAASESAASGEINSASLSGSRAVAFTMSLGPIDTGRATHSASRPSLTPASAHVRSTAK